VQQHKKLYTVTQTPDLPETTQKEIQTAGLEVRHRGSAGKTLATADDAFGGKHRVKTARVCMEVLPAGLKRIKAGGE